MRDLIGSEVATASTLDKVRRAARTAAANSRDYYAGRAMAAFAEEIDKMLEEMRK